ncbi:MAG: TrkH family potassium uptake protein [Desulfovermiculus sp.]|nr:TrkH family potassium uptake protein [Desulfovermiculus sp.]
MRWTFILQIVGLIILFVGLTMLLPLGFSLAAREESAVSFLQAIVLSIAFGGGLFLVSRAEKGHTVTHREGMCIVTLGWIGAGLFGSLPFYLSGSIPGFSDCVFETFSGFTTTGSTILDDIESLPSGILLWRSLTQWLGGMGIVLLSLAILPFIGVGGMQLYKAEVPGPSPDKLRPRVRETAKLLWQVYLLLSFLELLFLLAGGMSFFDSLCHTFTTMPTGGFSPKGASIGHYDSVYFDLVITFFMFMAGVNFVLHFRLIQGRPMTWWHSPEFRFYLLVTLGVTGIVALCIYGPMYSSLGQALRYSLFQVVSIFTTTGFGTADYELWGPLAQFLLLLCMIVGGSAGSTAGGVKCMRVIILIKQAQRELMRLVHPRVVVPIRLGGKIVSDEIVNGVVGFFLLYLVLAALSMCFLAALGVDILTSIGAVIACISNIGPGLGQVGPTEHFGHLPTLAKWILTFCMLLGRLEIYTVIVLLYKEFWKS